VRAVASWSPQVGQLAIHAVPNSPRRIDAVVAAVMAHDRAAALAGVTGGSIYI
jgi:hypothetical protein